ncbi:UDP-glucosyltransferase 2-like [Anthonomus grandis grandis]|uniref:UDP-glucosyltransferase 2-like n=1 Tax=Anthonomus grandis grandis TaxID=2921223 RepID=UPI00216533BC|nr:UDP-glucosyltransferase 2-like [Anthonomus grandis grandis]
MRAFTLLLLIQILCGKVTFGAKILCIASLPTYSHNLFFRPIWEALADRGHQLTVLTANPMGPHPNIQEIDLGFAYEKKKIVYTPDFAVTRFNWPFMIGRYMDMFIEVAAAELGSAQVQRLLTNQSEHFDLVIAEMHISAMFGFAHRFKCPLIGISSTDIVSYQHAILGNPTHVVQYPDLCSNMAPKRLTFEERTIELYNRIGTLIQQYIRQEAWNDVLQKYFGPDVPPLDDLVRSLYFVFLNVAPFANYRPLGPKFVAIGGRSHFSPSKPLGKELLELLDSNPQGVIYFSLGTNIKDSQISPHLLNVTMEAFKELPYQFIWKLGHTIPNLPENVRIYSWLPQQELLRHPHIKAFVFQGGVHSKEEAILARVPMVGIPIIGDQRKNVEDLVARGVGLLLDKTTISKEQLKGAIQRVIEDPSFKENLKTLSQMFQDYPQSGIERAVWHAEFALRNPQGAKLLGQPQLPWYQYYLLDILCVFVVVLGVVVGLVRWLVLALKRVFRSKVKVS